MGNSQYRRLSGKNQKRKASARIKKRKVQVTWVRFMETNEESYKHFRCFNQSELGFNREFSKKIVDAEQDDDYETDSDILKRSIEKVSHDLHQAVRSSLNGENVLRSSTQYFLEMNKKRKKRKSY